MAVIILDSVSQSVQLGIIFAITIIPLVISAISEKASHLRMKKMMEKWSKMKKKKDVANWGRMIIRYENHGRRSD